MADADWLDLPYTDEDLKKPGFDPFEAHMAWLARRAARTPQDEALARRAALARLDEHMAKWREEDKKPKPRKKRPPSEAAKSLKLWKGALAEVKARKKGG